MKFLRPETPQLPRAERFLTSIVPPIPLHPTEPRDSSETSVALGLGREPGQDKVPERWKGKGLEKLLVRLLESCYGAKCHRAQDSSRQRTGKDGKAFWQSNQNDLFDAFDFVALRMGRRDLYVQATTETNFTNRRKKIEEVMPWLDVRTKDVEVWHPYSQKIGSRTYLFILRRAWDGSMWQYDLKSGSRLLVPRSITEAG